MRRRKTASHKSCPRFFTDPQYQVLSEIANIEFKDIDLIIHPGASHEGVADRIVHYLHHYFGTSPEVRLINHQRAHIAGAFYASGFDEAMCMSYDLYGDRLKCSRNRQLGWY